MSRVTLELFGKPGCHLCDDAKVVLDDVLVDFPEVEIVEHNILNEPELFEAYRTLIPVIRIDGETHSIWRIDPSVLRDALKEATS